MFGSVVAGAFQIVFHAKYMPMIFFHFLKIIFDISTSKRSKKYKPHSILAKNKNQNLTKRSYKHNAKQSLKYTHRWLKLNKRGVSSQQVFILFYYLLIFAIKTQKKTGTSFHTECTNSSSNMSRFLHTWRKGNRRV